MAVEPVGRAFARKVHRAARIEDAMGAAIERRLRQRGWRTAIIPCTGYGGAGWARVMARVIVARVDPRPRRRLEKVRG